MKRAFAMAMIAAAVITTPVLAKNNWQQQQQMMLLQQQAAAGGASAEAQREEAVRQAFTQQYQNMAAAQEQQRQQMAQNAAFHNANPQYRYMAQRRQASNKLFAERRDLANKQAQLADLRAKLAYTPARDFQRRLQLQHQIDQKIMQISKVQQRIAYGRY